MDYEKLIKKAKLRTKEISAGTKFLLKDLFETAEWEELPIGNRQQLGRLFKNEVLDEKIPDVIWDEKKKGSTMYLKEGK